MPDVVIEILILASVLIFLLCLQDISEIFPFLLRGGSSWKECRNIELLPKLRFNRAYACLSVLLPLTLIIWYFELFPPATCFPEPYNLLSCAGVLFAYFIIRIVFRVIFRGRVPSNIWQPARRIPLTFFAFGGFLTIAVSLICLVCGFSIGTSRKVILYCISAVYLLCIFRKTQFLTINCGYFKGFLYLCTLELLPTGLLVFSAEYF